MIDIAYSHEDHLNSSSSTASTFTHVNNTPHLTWKGLTLHYLQQDLYDTALFYAERGYYEKPSYITKYLLAYTYFRMGKIKQTYLILEEVKFVKINRNQYLSSYENPDEELNEEEKALKQCLYLYALVCLNLDNLAEAESVLLPKSSSNSTSSFYFLNKNNTENISINNYEENFLNVENLRQCPGGAAGVLLLGKALRRQQKISNAKKIFLVALELDPFLWEAIIELSELGEIIDHDSYISKCMKPHEASTIHFPISSSTSNATTTPSNKQSKVSNNEKRKNLTTDFLLNSLKPSNTTLQDDHNNSLGVIDRLTGINGLSNSMRTSTPLPGGTSGGNNSSIFSDNHLNHSMELSSMSLKIPFATPGSMPSPITKNLQASSRFTNIHINMHPLTVSQSSTTNPFNQSLASRLPVSHSPYAPKSYDENEEDITINRTSIPAYVPTPSSARPLSNEDFIATPAQKSSDILSPGNNLHSHPPSGDFIQADYHPMEEPDDTDLLEGDTSVLGDLMQRAQRYSAQFNNQRNSSTSSRKVSFGPSSRLSFSSVADETNNNIDHTYVQNATPLKQYNGTSQQDSAIKINESHRYNHSFYDDTPLQTRNLIHSPYTSANDYQDDNSHLNTTFNQNFINSFASPSHSVKTPLHPSSSTLYRNSIATPRPSIGSTAQINSSINYSTHKSAYYESNIDLNLDNNDDIDNDIDSIIKVLPTYARALQQFSFYYNNECIETLETLPEKHFFSSYTCELIGKAYVNNSKYKESIIIFNEMFKYEPYRLSGLEYLSSSLWQLKLEKDLTLLAKQVLKIDKFSCITCCILGNLFSLLKDSENSIKYFLRSIELNKYFSYSYILCGYEYIISEDLDNAILFFRLSLLTNSNYANAWYGLGIIFYRQNRYELSEFYFKKSKKLNHKSSVLDCFLSMALSAQECESKLNEALELLHEAIERDPKNTQLRFQRANILIEYKENYLEAIEDLLLVIQDSPEEAQPHVLLGKAYSFLGESSKAILHYHMALDLDPKNNNGIKVRKNIPSNFLYYY